MILKENFHFIYEIWNVFFKHWLNLWDQISQLCEFHYKNKRAGYLPLFPKFCDVVASRFSNCPEKYSVLIGIKCFENSQNCRKLVKNSPTTKNCGRMWQIFLGIIFLGNLTFFFKREFVTEYIFLFSELNFFESLATNRIKLNLILSSTCSDYRF